MRRALVRRSLALALILGGLAPLAPSARAQNAPTLDPTAGVATDVAADAASDAASDAAFDAAVDIRVDAPTQPVEVGEPFDLTIVCLHGPNVEVRAAQVVTRDVLNAERGFHVFDVVALPDLPADGKRSRAFGFEDDAQLVTRITYRVASLSLEPAAVEGGGLAWNPERPLIGLGIEVAPALSADAPASTARLFEFRPARPLDGDVGPEAIVTVRSMIGPGARGPRPMPEPLTTDESAPPWGRAAWIGGSASLLFLVALAVALRGNRVARPSTGPPPDRAATLASLLEAVGSGEADLRQVAFDAVVHMRAGFADRGASNDRSLTDDEWRTALDERILATGERTDLDRFLARAEAVRYAPARPTRWAVEELVRDALVFERGTLERAQAPVPSSATVATTQNGGAE